MKELSLLEIYQIHGGGLLSGFSDFVETWNTAKGGTVGGIVAGGAFGPPAAPFGVVVGVVVGFTMDVLTDNLPSFGAPV